MNSISSSHSALENYSSISKDDLLRVFEKLPDECFMTDTSWFRKIGLVDKLGVVDFFTLLSNAWQELLLVRMLSPEQSQLTQLNGILAKFEVRHDVSLMMKVGYLWSLNSSQVPCMNSFIKFKSDFLFNIATSSTTLKYNSNANNFERNIASQGKEMTHFEWLTHYG